MAEPQDPVEAVAAEEDSGGIDMDWGVDPWPDLPKLQSLIEAVLKLQDLPFSEVKETVTSDTGSACPSSFGSLEEAGSEHEAKEQAKLQRRREKNRRTAATSRERQRAVQSGLQASVRDLTARLARSEATVNRQWTNNASAARSAQALQDGLEVSVGQLTGTLTQSEADMAQKDEQIKQLSQQLTQALKTLRVALPKVAELNQENIQLKQQLAAAQLDIARLQYREQ